MRWDKTRDPAPPRMTEPPKRGLDGRVGGMEDGVSAIARSGPHVDGARLLWSLTQMALGDASDKLIFGREYQRHGTGHLDLRRGS
jgi:hypothetical protein